MARLSRFLGVLLAAVPAIHADCVGVGDLSAFFFDQTHECFIDASTGTDLEMALGYQGDCSGFTIYASAVFTGTNSVATTLPSYNQGLMHSQADTDVSFLYFGFQVPYRDIKDGTPITWIRSFGQGDASAFLGSGVSTIHITPTLVYTEVTDTVISTTETTTSKLNFPYVPSLK